ncbi:MAG: elongation factor G, partial [Planctomycetota bacterium]
MGLDQLRNLAIVAHIDAGKTTTTERILHCAGVEARIGRVDDGTAVMDWMAEERERGITITAAATSFEWRGVAISLIDTPGHVDFTVEVERCMRVLDGAILVIDAVSGVQAQSETVWRQMAAQAVPAICFVNKCDRVGADYLSATASVERRLGAPAIPIQYPIYADGKLVGVVDLVTGCAWRFDSSGAASAVDVPPELVDEVEVLRSELIDVLAADDEDLLQALVDEREPDPDALSAALRRRVIGRSLLPTLCGGALRGIGIQPLLDAAVAYLPSPLDRPPIRGFDADGEFVLERAPDPDGALAALAFKLHTSAHGDQTFLRIYSGTLTPGDRVWNPRTARLERVARVLRMHAEHGEALEQASAGAIVAVTGLKATVTGDTLCDPSHVIQLEPSVFPEPVIALVVEP